MKLMTDEQETTACLLNVVIDAVNLSYLYLYFVYRLNKMQGYMPIVLFNIILN